MKVKLILLCFILYFCFCSSPNKWKGTKEIINGVTYINNTSEGIWRNSRKMVLKKILSIGIDNGDENYILCYPRDVKVDSAGDIYICDIRDDAIKVYDQNGVYVKRFGSKGKGPGELYGPACIALDENNNLYVYETGNLRISIFPCDNKKVKILRYKDYVSSIRNIAVSRDGFLFLSFQNSFQQSLDHHIFRFSRSLNKWVFDKAFGKPNLIGQSTLAPEFSEPWITVLNDNTLLAAFDYPYELRKYTTDGKLLRVIKKECQLFQLNKVLYAQNRFILLSQATIERVFTFPDGKFLVMIQDKGADYVKQFEIAAEKGTLHVDLKRKWFYDLFDREGRFLQRFRLEKEIGYIIYIDRKGYVYTNSSSDEIPRVTKYSVSFEEKD